MLANAISASIVGVDGVPVRVEVDVSFGLPGLTIVGLAGSAVLEARERVRAAIRNSGFEVPSRRITVNLAPADLPKEGTGHDLAMAVAILVASSQLETDLGGTALIGELALDGTLRPVPGAMALVSAARGRAWARRSCPPVTGRRARPWAASSCGRRPAFARSSATWPESRRSQPWPPHRRVPRRWHPTTLRTSRRLSGRPSAGAPSRSQLPAATTLPSAGRRESARRFWRARRPACCPHSMRRLRPRSAASIPWPDRRWPRPAFTPAAVPSTAPHHLHPGARRRWTAYPSGRGEPRPPRGALPGRDAPVSGRCARRAARPDRRRNRPHRACRGRHELPARFMLLAAFNPCPCGWFGVDRRDCRCDDGARRRYQARLSGPMRDRLDLVVFLEPTVRSTSRRTRRNPRPSSPVALRAHRPRSAAGRAARTSTSRPMRSIGAMASRRTSSTSSSSARGRWACRCAGCTVPRASLGRLPTSRVVSP